MLQPSPNKVILLLALTLTFMQSALANPQSLTKSPTAQTGTSPVIAGAISQERLLDADKDQKNWLAYGRTYEEQRFSPLDQINKSTVKDLGLAWHKDMESKRALEATPIVVDGVMYLTATWGRVFAIDAMTGEEIWRFDPEVPGSWARKGCCGIVNRGVAVYEGQVFVGSYDGRLIALDAATGGKNWEVNTLIEGDWAYTITGAPRIANGKVFIGNGGAEYGVRGYVTAYDTGSGEQIWRFFTVPGDPSKPFENEAMELAAKTWEGTEWWKFGGGGTVWNSIVYDPEFNSLYIGVGNGSPWNRAIRSEGTGDNLFLSSIVALDADSGEMKWYYQTTPGDRWDYTAVQDIVLSEMEIDGTMHKVLMQAPKNGFFYVIDRKNGKLLRAHKYTAITWASHVDMETGRPVINPSANYLEEAQWILPGPLGGHNWQAMSYDAKKRIMYIPAIETPFVYAADENWKKSRKYERKPNSWNTGIELANLIQIITNMGTPPPGRGGGHLIAFDPLTGETKWEVNKAHHWNGGVLATAGGLVFQGDFAGNFYAYDADSGSELWKFSAYTAFLAPPVTYEIGGEQYVAVLAGTGGADIVLGGGEGAARKYGNEGKLLVFKLGGTKTITPPPVKDRAIPELPTHNASSEDMRKGGLLYGEVCAVCHGPAGISSGVIPDLRMSPVTMDEGLYDVVLKGYLEDNGMPDFSDILNEEQVRQIQAYIIQQARIAKESAP